MGADVSHKRYAEVWHLVFTACVFFPDCIQPSVTVSRVVM